MYTVKLHTVIPDCSICFSVHVMLWNYSAYIYNHLVCCSFNVCIDQSFFSLSVCPLRRHLSCQHCNLGPKLVQYIRMKLGTHVARDNMHMYSKGHYPRFINYNWVMPFFDFVKQTSIGVHSAALLFAIMYMRIYKEALFNLVFFCVNINKYSDQNRVGVLI